MCTCTWMEKSLEIQLANQTVFFVFSLVPSDIPTGNRPPCLASSSRCRHIWLASPVPQIHGARRPQLTCLHHLLPSDGLPASSFPFSCSPARRCCGILWASGRASIMRGRAFVGVVVVVGWDIVWGDDTEYRI